MKKKFFKRVAAFALSVVFTVTLIGAPRTKAVAVEAAAIGAAVLATYMAASGLNISVDSPDTIFSGISSMVTDYLASVQSSVTDPDSWLAYIGEDTVLESPGIMQLESALTRTLGQFVDWVTETFGLTEEGSEVVSVPGVSDFYSYGGVDLPSVETVWTDKVTYPYAFIRSNGDLYTLYLSKDPVSILKSTSTKFNFSIGSHISYSLASNAWSSPVEGGSASGPVGRSSQYAIWASCDLLFTDGSIYLPFSIPVPVGDVVGQVGISRGENFTDIATDAGDRPVTIFVPQTITKPDDLAMVIPEQIAAGTLAPTYELAQEGTDTPEEETGIYIPTLNRIHNALTGLGDSIVNGIMSGLESLFVPSEAYLEVLPQQITNTFDSRTGFLTYPFSLLADFVGRISATSQDWILSWPQISEPFSGAVLFQPGTFNVSSFVRSNVQIKKLYDLWRLLAKVLMSFGLISLCYKKYRSVVGDKYGG